MTRYERVAEQVLSLANSYRDKLKSKIKERKQEMEEDDLAHHLVYSSLGISHSNGIDIDFYQNVGRFLYTNSGNFIEQAAIICLQDKFPGAKKKKITNRTSSGSKTFEIDCLIGRRAHEIKWRHATTDGDHLKKEKFRIESIKKSKFTPIRLVFFSPNRKAAKKIQKNLKDLYEREGGEYYEGKAAWSYLRKLTGVNLKKVLEEVSKEVSNMRISKPK